MRSSRSKASGVPPNGRAKTRPRAPAHSRGAASQPRRRSSAPNPSRVEHRGAVSRSSWGVQEQTALVHRLFQEYDEASREAARVCGTSFPASACVDEDLYPPPCEECREAEERYAEAKERLVRAARELNSM